MKAVFNHKDPAGLFQYLIDRENIGVFATTQHATQVYPAQIKRATGSTF